jgi:Phytanoyl-CoA dioxygenase (PhyH)
MSSETWRPSADPNDYARDGCLLIPAALAPDEVAGVTATVDGLVGRLREQPGFAERHTESAHSVRIRHAVGQEPRLLDLVDHERILDPLVRTLGPYVSLVGSEVFVRSASAATMVRYHTDGGPAMQAIRLDHGHRALQLKVQIFLTDVSEPDHGNLVVIPGSHERVPHQRDPNDVNDYWLHEANEHLDRGEAPPGAVQVLAARGDALLFPYSLWHAVAPNSGGRTRKSVILRYGHLWHRPFDYVAPEPALLEVATERQRRMLGHLAPGAPAQAWYKAQDQAEVMGLRPRTGAPAP